MSSPRWSRRRLWLTASGILLALPLAGALFQALSVRQEFRRFPPAGRFITVSRPGEGAERRLHLLCLGQGEPTVIFESSGLGDSSSSRKAREEISRYTRVCSYDRMGMGWSDPGPGVISAGLLADDLERLVTQAGLRPPLILVPASLGGLTAELFARTYPRQVAGLVFVDAGNGAILQRVAKHVNWLAVASVCLVQAAARVGVLRLYDPLGFRRQPSVETAQAISRLYRVEPMSTLCAVVRGIPTTTRELAAAPPLPPDIPLAVLVHEKPDGLLPPGLSRYAPAIDREWLAFQQRFAKSSLRGTWRVVPGSDHLVGNSQPHAVAAAVLAMLADLRSAASSRPDPQ